MPEKFTNFAKSTLNGSITNSTTSIVVVSGASFPSTGTFRITIEDEIIICSARSSNTITAVTRGAEGTTAVSHATGVVVESNLTAGSLTDYRNYLLQRGAFSSRPSPADNILYMPTDVPGIYQSNGTDWANYGPIRKFAGFDQTGFSWNNQGSATLVVSGYQTAMITVPTAGGAEDIHFYGKAVSGAFTATACYTTNLYNDGTCRYGLMAYNSGNDRRTANTQDESGQLGWDRYTDALTLNSQGKIAAFNMGPGTTIWSRLVGNGTTLFGYNSFDGINWTQIWNETYATFLTTITAVGPYIDIHGGNTAYVNQGIIIHELTIV